MWYNLENKVPKKGQKIIGQFDNNEDYICYYINQNKQVGEFETPINYKLLKWKNIDYEFGFWK